MSDPTDGSEARGGAMEVEEFLKHHGIRGMKWGVRRSPAQLSRAPSSGAKTNDRAPWHSPPGSKVIVAPHPSGTTTIRPPKLKKGKQPSQDALEIMALRDKVKKHGASSLTNDDLQKIAKRVELQEKYNKAFPKKPSKKSIAAKVAIDLILSNEGSKKVSTFATTKLSNPYAANTLYDLFKPGGPASQFNQVRKSVDQAKNKKKK